MRYWIANQPMKCLKQHAEETQRQQMAQKAEAEQTRKPGATKTTGRSSNRQSMVEAMLKSAARSVGSQLGRRIVRGLLGSLLGGR